MKTYFAAIMAVAVVTAAPAIAATNNSNGGCDVRVAQIQDAARDNYILSRATLADKTYSRRPQSFSQMSCLERLMNSGTDIMFRPPSLSALLSSLTNFVCNQANGVFRQVTGPINQGVNGRVNSGDIIPGVNIGSLGGGVDVRTRTGQQGGLGTVNTNVNSVLGGSSSSNRTSLPGTRLGDLF